MAISTRKFSIRKFSTRSFVATALIALTGFGSTFVGTATAASADQNDSASTDQVASAQAADVQAADIDEDGAAAWEYYTDMFADHFAHHTLIQHVNDELTPQQRNALRLGVTSEAEAAKCAADTQWIVDQNGLAGDVGKAPFHCSRVPVSVSEYVGAWGDLASAHVKRTLSGQGLPGSTAVTGSNALSGSIGGPMLGS